MDGMVTSVSIIFESSAGYASPVTKTHWDKGGGAGDGEGDGDGDGEITGTGDGDGNGDGDGLGEGDWRKNDVSTFQVRNVKRNWENSFL